MRATTWPSIRAKRPKTKDGSPPFGGWPTSQGRSHSVTRMKTYLYKYSTRCNPFYRGTRNVPGRDEVVEGGIEDRDKDAHEPFEDLRGEVKDTTVTLSKT